MQKSHEYGIGELLRHLTELIDRSSESFYKEQNLQYRPRYTPIMRVLADGPCSVNDITAKLAITQGAVSQSLKLMEKESLIKRKTGADSRQYIISLTRKGRSLLAKLKIHWQLMFRAIESLEEEIDAPLRITLERTIHALERKGFRTRITEVMRDENERYT